jgi:hypothetical protein
LSSIYERQDVSAPATAIKEACFFDYIPSMTLSRSLSLDVTAAVKIVVLASGRRRTGSLVWAARNEEYRCGKQRESNRVLDKGDEGNAIVAKRPTNSTRAKARR